MKSKTKFFLKFILLVFTIILVSCSNTSSSSDSSSSTQTTTYPSRLIDLSIDGATTPVMIALNTNKNASATYESAGVTPRIFKQPLYSKSNSKKRISLNDVIKNIQQGPNKKINSPKLSVTESTTTTTFKVYNFDNPMSPFTISANRMYNGTYCYIFVNSLDQSSIDQSDINLIGNEFDTKIYNRAKDYLTSFYDVDNNNKIIILIYDLNENSTNGYFWSGDFYKQEQASNLAYTNEADMFYLNAYQVKNLKKLSGIDRTSEYNNIINTVAHELVHLINLSSRFKTNNSSYINTPFDTWIEEGIAEGVTPFLTDLSLDNHFDDLNSSNISNGLGLIKWKGNENDYSLSFTFFEYLRIQCNLSYSFYKQVMESYTVNSNYLAVESVFKGEASNPFDNFDDALLSYKIANYYNLNSGKYGYKGQYSTPSLSSPATSTLDLDPGGSGYFSTNLNNFVPTNVGENIYYYRINYTP